MVRRPQKALTGQRWISIRQAVGVLISGCRSEEPFYLLVVYCDPIVVIPVFNLPILFLLVFLGYDVIRAE